VVFVDAKDEAAKTFFGFVSLEETELFLPLPTIRLLESS